MATQLLETKATANRLRQLASTGHLSQSALERALTLIGQIPSADRWRALLKVALLVVGAAFAVSGIVFFFAYNWADLPPFFKFGLIEATMVLCVGLATYLNTNTLAGKTALVGAAILVGVLQAVYGQVYQTGADSHQLFFGWAVLILGWVLVSANVSLWFLLVLLLNLGLGSYLSLGSRPSVEMNTALLALNAGALFTWEYARQHGVTWLAARWPIRLIACAALSFAVILVLDFLFSYLFSGSQQSFLQALAPVLYLCFTSSILFLYSRKVIDLFILTTAALSVVVVITSALVRLFVDSWFGSEAVLSLSLIGSAIVGQMTVAFLWLRSIAATKEKEAFQ